MSQFSGSTKDVDETIAKMIHEAFVTSIGINSERFRGNVDRAREYNALYRAGAITLADGEEPTGVMAPEPFTDEDVLATFDKILVKQLDAVEKLKKVYGV